MIVVRRKSPGEGEEDGEIDILGGSDDEPDLPTFEPISIPKGVKVEFPCLSRIEPGRKPQVLKEAFAIPQGSISYSIWPISDTPDLSPVAEDNPQLPTPIVSGKEDGEVDSEEDESFLIKDLKEREFWAMMERKTFQEESEKKDQMVANLWLLGKRRSSEQLRKERELEVFLTSNIWEPLPDEIASQWDDIPEVPLPAMNCETQVLETPGWKVIEDEDSSYDSVRTSKFLKDYQTGLIDSSGWTCQLEEMRKKRFSRSMGSFERAAKRQKSSHNIFKRTKSKETISAPSEPVPIHTHFSPEIWTEEEKAFAKELVLIFKRDWKTISILLWETKNPSQIRLLFEPSLDGILGEKEKKPKLKKSESLKAAAKISQICYRFSRVITATTTNPQSLDDTSLQGDFEQEDFIQDGEPSENGIRSSHRRSHFTSKFSVGSTAFVFLKNKTHLPRGGWLEAHILEVRVNSVLQKYERAEYLVRLAGRNTAEEAMWIGEDSLRKTLTVGTPVYECEVFEPTANRQNIYTAPITLPPLLSTPSSPTNPPPKAPCDGKGLAGAEPSISLLLDSLNIQEAQRILVSESDSGVTSMSTSLCISPLLSNRVDSTEPAFNPSNLSIEIPPFNFDENSLLKIDFTSIFAAVLGGNIRSPKVLQENFDSILGAIDKAVDLVLSPSHSNGKTGIRLIRNGSNEVGGHLNGSPRRDSPRIVEPTIENSKFFFAKREILLECARCLQIRCREVSNECKHKAELLNNKREVMKILKRSTTNLLDYKRMIFLLAAERYNTFESQLKSMDET